MIKIAMLKFVLIIIALLLFTNTISATIQVNILPNSTNPVNFSSGNTGNMGTENAYSQNLPFAEIGAGTAITAQNLTMLSNFSSTRTGWHNQTGSTTLDSRILINFTQTNVQSVNWIVINVSTWTSLSDTVKFGVRNYTKTGYNLTGSAATTQRRYFTFNISGATNITNFVSMTGNTANWSVAVWSNGGTISTLVADYFNTTISYEPVVVYNPINITNNGNNATNNNTLSFAINQNDTVNFNLTTNMTVNSNTTAMSSGVNSLGNSSLGLLSFWANFSFPTFGTQYVNLTVGNNSATYDYRNWTITVKDVTAPFQITNFINTTFPTFNSVSLSWAAPTDNSGGSGVNRTYIDKLNDSILFSSNPVLRSPTINATNIRSGGATTNWTSGKYSDASYYTMRNNAPSVQCNTCHSTSPNPADYNISVSPFFMKFNTTHLLVFGHIPDNDTDIGDDYFGIGIASNTTNSSVPRTTDIMYNLYENGSMYAYNGTGSGWALNVSLTNISAVAGAGTNAPRYEMAIPLSQIGNPTNLSAVKFIIDTHCTNGSDFIERAQHFPENANNDVPSEWFTAIYRNVSQWDNYSVSTSPTATTITLTGLTSNFRYNFTAYARDNSTNNGTRSAPLIIRTSDRVGYNISGFVNSSSGAVVGATITISEYSVLTNSTGYFKLYSIIDGTYVVNATYLGRNANNNERSVTINGANNITTNFTIPLDKSSNVTQKIIVEDIITVTKTAYPVNYTVDPEETQQPVEVSAYVDIRKISAYIIGTAQNVAFNTSVKIIKTIAPIYYYANETQKVIIENIVNVTKIVAPILYNSNSTQTILILGLVNITKTTSQVNYNRNISQSILIGNFINVSKTASPINYSINISQQLYVNNYVKVSKTFASVNYSTNISQQLSIENYVYTIKTVSPINYSSNITQNIVIGNVVSVLKTSPSKYYANTTQSISILQNVNVIKILPSQNYTSNITQTVNIGNFINITKQVSPILYYANISQNIMVVGIVNVSKINASSHNLSNVTQSISISGSINVTKSIRIPVNYTINLTQTINKDEFVKSSISGNFTLNGYIFNSLEYQLSARIDIINGSNSIAHTFTNSDTGYYSLSEIPEGNYTVLVRQIRYRNSTQDINLTENTNLNITINKIRMPVLKQSPGFEGMGLLFVIIFIIIIRKIKYQF